MLLIQTEKPRIAMQGLLRAFNGSVKSNVYIYSLNVSVVFVLSTLHHRRLSYYSFTTYYSIGLPVWLRLRMYNKTRTSLIIDRRVFDVL